MQVMAFAILMIILLAAGGTSVTAGVILAVAGRFFGKRGCIGKWRVIISVVLICLGVVMILIPAGWLLMIRASNSTIADDYKDTGVMVVWEKGSRFTYDGKVYVELEKYLKETSTYSLSVACDEKDSDPEFNIRQSTGFWQILFNAYEKDNVYRIDSGAGIRMYYCSSGLYCPEDEIEKALKYYSDSGNYNWIVMVYDDDDNEHEHQIELSKSDIAFFDSFDSSDRVAKFESDKMEGSAELVKRSRDGNIEFDAFLMKYKGSWYREAEDASDEDIYEFTYSLGQKLPEDISRKISAAVSGDDK